MDLEYEKKDSEREKQIQKFILGNQPFYNVTIYRQTWTTAAVKQ